MLEALDSPYNKWVAGAVLALCVLDLDLLHLATPLLHIYVAALLIAYGCYIMLRVRWKHPIPNKAAPPPYLQGETSGRGYVATVAIVACLFLYRTALLIASVACFAHAAAKFEPSLYSSIAETTLPYVTMQFRHTAQILADILELLFSHQSAVTINRSHWLALPFKAALSIVHSILIVGTATVIFKLGMNKGALNEIEKTLSVGGVELAPGPAKPQPAH
jgi:hypothetical protein